MADMRPSQWLFDFLRQWERFRPTAYKPTSRDVWTIGYGHTHGVNEGDTCTTAQAAAWLHDDVAWAVWEVNTIKRVMITQPQFDALVSLCFNIGAGAFGASTLLQLLNSGANKLLVAGQFPRWNKQRGVVLDGLTRRREAERERFLEPAHA